VRNPASAAGRALRALRKTDKTRPVVLHVCKHCGEGFAARAIRKHQARCPKNPKICPRIQAELHKGAL
jgi:predicted Zn-ribbon and HTH transcriptional regulator